MRTALAAVLATFLVAGTASANITISGNGKVTYVPTLAHLRLSITSEGKTAAEAWRLNGEQVKKAFGVLKEYQIAEKDYQTAGLHINPKYVHTQGQPPQLVGYTVSYDLTVTVRKLGQLGALLDRL